MKKMYITPAVEINETMIASMMALSLYDEPADNNGILVESENINWWDIWDEE